MDPTPRSTRAGTPVLIFGEHEGHLFGAYDGKNGQWYPMRWTKNGYVYAEEDVNTSLDLV